MPQTLTFKGELITLPDMPEPFYWEVNEIDIDLRKRNVTSALGSNLESWTRLYSGEIHVVVSRVCSMQTAGYRMPSWQAALDYLAMRALLGGVDDGEKGDV